MQGFRSFDNDIDEEKHSAFFSELESGRYALCFFVDGLIVYGSVVSGTVADRTYAGAVACGTFGRLAVIAVDSRSVADRTHSGSMTGYAESTLGIGIDIVVAALGIIVIAEEIKSRICIILVGISRIICVAVV